MFGFLGGRNRKRQIQDANRNTNKGKARPKKNDHKQQQQQHYRQPSLDVDQFLDNISVDMSLYTTPSKATVQYHRGVYNMHDWQSEDSSVTPDVASVQSRLGGWEAPSQPRPIPEVDEEEEQSKRSSPARNKGAALSQKSAGVLSYNSYSKKASLSSSPPNRRRPHDDSFQNSLKSSGPVDVDSLTFVDDDEPEQETGDFSDLLSTFEAHSLADRMTPNTGLTYHERAQARVAGKTIGRGRDDASKRSSGNISNESRSSRGAVSKQSSSKSRVSRSKGSKPSSPKANPISPSGTKTSHRSQIHSTAEGMDLDFDDSRSLGTEVSGLTMLTMEQPMGLHPRTSHSASPRSKQYLGAPSVVSEGPSVFSSVPEDVSFSGLLSKCEDESRLGLLDPRRDEQRKVTNSADFEGSSDVHSMYFESSNIEGTCQTPALVNSLDDVSFSGLLSTIEAESLAGRMDETSELGNLEIPDSKSLMSSVGSLPDQMCLSCDGRESVDTESSRRETSTLRSLCEEDEIGAEPLTPAARSDSMDISSVKRTQKRSNTNPSSSENDCESNSLSSGRDEAASFSKILSKFEAKSAASNKLEPPATKRLLPNNDFPMMMKGFYCNSDVANETSQQASLPHIIEDDCSEKITDGSQEEDNSTNHGDTYSMDPMLPDHSCPPILPDDGASSSSSSASSGDALTIDDQSTIQPPPKPDEYNWNEDSWNPPVQRSNHLFTSVGSTEIDGMSRISATEGESYRSDHDSDVKSSHYIDHYSFATPKGSKKQSVVTPPLLSPFEGEHSLQYSASAGSSMQYSESTAPVNVVSDISSLLMSAEKHRGIPRRQQGPVDLDETVADSISESSSLCGTGSALDITRTTPSKSVVNADVASPLSPDEEDEHQFVDDDDDLENCDDRQRNSRRLSNLDYVDEATVDYSYKETMESLSSARSDSGSVLLTEEELQRHMKSTQFKGSLPSSSLTGYDKWKRKEFAKQRYFAKVHENAMKRKEKRDKLLERRNEAPPAPPSASSRQRSVPSTATSSLMERSTSSTIQTSRPLDPLPRQKSKKHGASEPKRRWGLLRASPKRNTGSTASSMSARSSVKSKTSNAKKREPVVVPLDYFMSASQGDPDDISLVPMNKLNIGVSTLTSSVPQGDTAFATKSHNLDDAGVGPRLLALQHLEKERAKTRHFEKDKTRLEIREQKRIALLKERELERQRHLNSLQPGTSVQDIFSSKRRCGSEVTGADQLLERNLSFGTTNTAQSSIKSPSCVLSPCILCNAAERSHVAQPCMHFYFCEDCANKLSSSSASPVCPICTTPNVAFSRVYT